ncbi:hypothetical protein Tco_1122116 [Tanacetum coccineum]|uniref:Uncharacterized protein n=1 Tax=Tanacetum coccineum TaxID=301880 RepID=A0ABQ5J034_9ASTR
MHGLIGGARVRSSELRGRVNLLYSDRPIHHHLAVMVEREAWMAREAWGFSMDISDDTCSHVLALRTTVVEQRALISGLQAEPHRDNYAMQPVKYYGLFPASRRKWHQEEGPQEPRGQGQSPQLPHRSQTLLPPPTFGHQCPTAGHD